MKGWIIYFVTILTMLFIAVFYHHYATPMQYHYIGETKLTTEQFIEIQKNINDSETKMLSKDIGGLYEYILIVNEDGSLTLSYDLYSSKEFKYLDNKEMSTVDKLIPTEMLHKKLTYIADAFAIVIMMFVLYMSKYHPRKVLSVYDGIVNKAINSKDKKYDIPSFSNIVKEPNDIKIDGTKGIICVRSWKIEKSGKLVSIVKNTEWKFNELHADVVPSKDDMKGIYAYRIGTPVGQKTNAYGVMGIVELDGKYEYHPDGVVRAEHCKIIGLFISKRYQNLGRLLSYTYNVPVYFDNNPLEGYSHWVISDEGLKGFIHNHKLLEESNGNSNNT